MKIIKAEINDAKELTELAIIAKTFWGYSNVQIEKWHSELTITTDYIKKNTVFKLCNLKEIVGFYAYYLKENIAEIDFLFVSPKYIRNGFGKLLLQHCLCHIKNTKSIKITLDSDPNAEEFYKKQGFETVKFKKSSIKNRFLPVMEMKLQN